MGRKLGKGLGRREGLELVFLYLEKSFFINDALIAAIAIEVPSIELFSH